MAERISFFGFVDLPRFSALMSEADLVFGLRFPSCGESSGMLNRARVLGVPVATSDYGAFREEPSAFLCRADLRHEQNDILESMETAYERWKTHGSTRGLPVRQHYHFPPKRGMGAVLADWLLQPQRSPGI